VSGAGTEVELSRARRTPRLHALGVLLAVVSLCIQSFVVQPHIDGLAFARADAHAVVAHAKSPAQAPGACVFCQEAALAGAVTLTAAPSLVLVERSLFNQTPVLRQRVVCRAPSHNWQSRAPPYFI
jgi:hypothetical protein